MTAYLVFDATCAPCSKVARSVDALNNDSLVALGFNDERVRGILQRQNIEKPEKPLMVVDDNEDVRVLSGLKMRIELARRVGLRHGQSLLRLAWDEQYARAQRKRGTPRRLALGIAGAVGLGTILGATPAEAATTSSERQPRPQELSRVRSAPQVRSATRRYGPVVDVSVVREGDTDIAVLQHEGDPGAATLVDLSSNPLDTTLTMVHNSEGASFFDSEGKGLFALKVIEDKFVIEPLGTFPIGWITCMTVCFAGEDPTAACTNYCQNCAFAGDGTISRITWCSFCRKCAGPKAAKCFKTCKVERK